MARTCCSMGGRGCRTSLATLFAFLTPLGTLPPGVSWMYARRGCGSPFAVLADDDVPIPISKSGLCIHYGGPFVDVYTSLNVDADAHRPSSVSEMVGAGGVCSVPPCSLSIPTMWYIHSADTQSLPLRRITPTVVCGDQHLLRNGTISVHKSFVLRRGLLGIFLLMFMSENCCALIAK